MDEEEDYITFYGEMVECFRIALKKMCRVSLLDKLQFEFECFDFNCFPIAKYPIKIGKIELAINNQVLRRRKSR